MKIITISLKFPLKPQSHYIYHLATNFTPIPKTKLQKKLQSIFFNNWNKLSQAKEATLSHKLYIFLKSLLDKYSTDETFLRNFSSKKAAIIKEDEYNHPPIEIYYYSNPSLNSNIQLDQTSFEKNFHEMLNYRKKHHATWLGLSLLAIPFSLLFTVIPGPNIPLFYNLFRIYSHYGSHWSAKYLLKAKFNYINYNEKIINDNNEILLDELKKISQKYNWEGNVDELIDIINLGKKQYLSQIVNNKQKID